MKIEFDQIQAALGGKEILKGVSLTAEDRQMTGIIGPNGCGKSTLLKTLFGIVPMKGGSIRLDGNDISGYSRKKISSMVGYVGQDVPVAFDFSVRDVVEMALYNTASAGRKETRQKRNKWEIIDCALEEMNIMHLAERSILSLSGGERKMVFLADLNLGEISSYPPGYKENAGIFCHNNPWVSIAETVIGRGNRAFEIYKKTCPSYIEGISEIHCTEPYIYSQMVAGADAVFHGQAKNSWLTGTAAWTFWNLSQAILGVQPSYDGLCINPCIPEGFGDFKLTRTFRDAVYYIDVKNPDNVQKGVKKVVVDGKEHEGCLIPFEEGKKEYHVTVYMG